jgi:hypothetical protein
MLLRGVEYYYARAYKASDFPRKDPADRENDINPVIDHHRRASSSRSRNRLSHFSRVLVAFAPQEAGRKRKKARGNELARDTLEERTRAIAFVASTRLLSPLCIV